MVGKFLQGKIFHKETETKDSVHIERLGKAFSQISSGINTHKDLKTILETVTREVLNCLKAQRSTIFFRNDKGDGLDSHLTCASDRTYEQACVNEEKEVAQKALLKNKPFVLRKPEDFSEFSKAKRAEQKITSLMNVPLSSGDRAMGVLSAVVFNGHSFNLQSLQFFSIFANHVSIALEMARLSEDLRKARGVREAYDRKMDEIVTQVQSIPLQERQRLEDHIVILQGAPETDEKKPFAGKQGKGSRGYVEISFFFGIRASIKRKRQTYRCKWSSGMIIGGLLKTYSRARKEHLSRWPTHWNWEISSRCCFTCPTAAR